MKNLGMAIVAGCKSGESPRRPEARAVRNGKQTPLTAEREVPLVPLRGWLTKETPKFTF